MNDQWWKLNKVFPAWAHGNLVSLDVLDDGRVPVSVETIVMELFPQHDPFQPFK